MSNDIVTSENNVPAISDQTLVEYLDAMGLSNSLKPAQKVQFLNMAKANGLNPFKREIYAVSYGGNFSIITGYEVYLKRAERTGKLDGWEAGVSKDGNEDIGWVKIYRKDWSHPFTHTVYKSEVQKPGPFWQKSWRFQLRKTAISQGFRLCFPDELGGMPYTEDELCRGDEDHYEAKEAEIVEHEVVAEEVKPEPVIDPRIASLKQEIATLMKKGTNSRAVIDSTKDGYEWVLSKYQDKEATVESLQQVVDSINAKIDLAERGAEAAFNNV